MKKRNPFAVFGLSLITLGIYDIYWMVVTKKELNKSTRIKIPSIWLLFAPVLLFIPVVIIVAMNSKPTSSTTFTNGSLATSSTSVNSGAVVGILLYVVVWLILLAVSFYWFFKFSKAVNEYTNGKSSTALTFILLWILHFIGVAIVQDSFNDMMDNEVPVPAMPSSEPAQMTSPVQPTATTPTNYQAPTPPTDNSTTPPPEIQ